MSQHSTKTLPRTDILSVVLIEPKLTTPSTKFSPLSTHFGEFSIWSRADIDIRLQSILNYLRRQEWSFSRCGMDSERWVTVDDVAAHLGVTRDSIYRWMNSKNLPAHRVGRAWRFRLSEIDEWVRSGRGATNEEQEEPEQDV